MALNAEDYMLFTENDFANIIGETMATKLADRGVTDYPTYFITYASQMIALYVREHTSLNIYKVENSEDYDVYLAKAKKITLDYTIIDGYIVGSSNDRNKNWLSETLGGQPLTPNNYNVYLIKTEGQFYNKYYKFNGKEYVEFEVPYLIMPIKLTSDQINMLKLACVYQADYIIDNGSTERMTAMGMVNRSNKYNKKDLKEFEICSMSKSLLDNAGLSYQGIGGDLYVKLK